MKGLFLLSCNVQDFPAFNEFSEIISEKHLHPNSIIITVFWSYLNAGFIEFVDYLERLLSLFTSCNVFLALDLVFYLVKLKKVSLLDNQKQTFLYNSHAE